MFKKILRISWIIITIVAALVYIVQSFSPYIKESDHPIFILLSLGYLFILLGYTCIMLAWLFIKRRIFFVLLILFFVGYKNFSSSVGTHFFSGFKAEKDTSNLRVMSWNVREFNFDMELNTKTSSLDAVMNTVVDLNADVVCLQDVSSNLLLVNLEKKLKTLQETTDYKYSCYYNSIKTYGLSRDRYVEFGILFISKFPVTNKDSLQLPSNNPLPEYLGYIDILYKKKPVRIYTSHLQSMSLWPGDEGKGGANFFKGDSTIIKLQATFNKLKTFKQVHTQQSVFIKNELNKSPYPFIFCGDLNSVPTSFVYHNLKTNLKDVFEEKGFGIDGTYNRIFPKQRIDVMLTTKDFTIKQYKRVVTNKSLSDHYPIIADVTLD